MRILVFITQLQFYFQLYDFILSDFRKIFGAQRIYFPKLLQEH